MLNAIITVLATGTLSQGATFSNLKFIPPKVKNGHSHTSYLVGSRFNQMKQTQDNTHL